MDLTTPFLIELYERYTKVRELVRDMGTETPLKPLPFNSGYFMTFELLRGSAETLRRKLMHDYGVGTISIQDRYLRVAYSSVDVELLPELYATIARAAEECCLEA